MSLKQVIVVGAGWSGAVVAHRLTRLGFPVGVVERAPVTGGHARVETLNGVVYEPNGAHIFHTDDPAVAHFVMGLGIARPYCHRVLTEVPVGDDLWLMSWPIQVDELACFPDAARIAAELDALPPEPRGTDFESYVASMMGRTLYERYVEGYTRKQWGCEPRELSWRLAPRRVELRRDGNRNLFRDRYVFFAPGGPNAAIDRVLAGTEVTTGLDVDVSDLEGCGADAVVITAALDELTGQDGALAWRGIRTESTFFPTEPTGTMTEAYVINRASLLTPYTRTIETKHATGQEVSGSVVSYEYPGAAARHYPVPTVDDRYERANAALQDEIRARLAPIRVFFAGRLATYRYIDQDQAIAGAFTVAGAVASALAR
jgi:UDP-galactopyranose mutase